jgi:hypothetical protein
MNPQKDERGFIVVIGILCILVALWLVAYVLTHPPIAQPPPQFYPAHSIHLW